MSELDFPPSKRRRTTLTDTLLTSALNIALISGAVGMTAYRMWKGEPNSAEEGDESGAYEEDSWQAAARATRSCPMSPSASSSSTKVTSSSSSSGHRRIRSHVASRRRPAFIAPPRPASTLASSVQYSGSQDPTPLPVPASSEPTDETDEMDEQMDWMSAQLQQLIAEGQKALGKEIVVSSDDVVGEEEGIVDDGDECWQDDEPYDSRGRQSGSRHARTSSASGRISPLKRRHPSPRKPANLATPDSSYLSRTVSLSRSSARQSLTSTYTPHSDFSPLQPSFNLSSSVPTQSSFEGLYQSTQVQPTLGQASFSQNNSPDLVSAMQRVRQAYGLGA
ncbi:hypothetical protein FRC05_006607 [Tulasnella sp. 425]|nr:hypothetical protein FRC05_006607 [Tulasnella sp. 425]